MPAPTKDTIESWLRTNLASEILQQPLPDCVQIGENGHTQDGALIQHYATIPDLAIFYEGKLNANIPLDKLSEQAFNALLSAVGEGPHQTSLRSWRSKALI